jgi:hypothetical protein
VALNRQERQALREIEEDLTREDPALAALFRRGGVPWGQYVTRRMVRVVIGSALALLALGLLLSDAAMICAAVLIFAALPIGIRFARALLGHEDSAYDG